MRQSDQMDDQAKKFENMMKPENIGPMARSFIALGSVEMLKGIADKINIQVDGPQLLQCAIQHRKLPIVEALLKMGMQSPSMISNPPTTIPHDAMDPQSTVDYRKAPYIIQACVSGNIPVYDALIKAGLSHGHVGHICLSKKRKNTVISNVIGATAYWGKTELLKHILKDIGQGYIDVQCLESTDIQAGKAGPLQQEYLGYSPLMLAVVSPHSDLEVIKTLLEKQADFQVQERNTGNNLIHIAALHCDNIDVFTYLVRNLKIDIFQRNTAGDTAFSICQSNGDKAKLKEIEAVKATNDNHRSKADDLLKELENAEEKAKKLKEKNKEKKKRNKLQKAAEKQGITIDELGRQIEAKADEDKREEERMLKAEQEKEKEEERKRKQLREARAREEKEAHAEQRRLEEEERIEAQRARAKRAADRAAARAAEARVQQQTEEVATKDEESKTQGLNRKQRRALEFQKRTTEASQTREQESADATNDEQTEQAVEKVTPAPADVTDAAQQVNPLSNLGKRAKKKLAEQKKREEEEERLLKERILQSKQDFEAEKKRKEKQDKDSRAKAKKQAIDEIKKAEEEEKLAMEKATEARRQKAKELKNEQRSRSQKSVSFSLAEQSQEAAPFADLLDQKQKNEKTEAAKAKLAEKKAAQKQRKADAKAARLTESAQLEDESKDASQAAAIAPAVEKQPRTKASKAQKENQPSNDQVSAEPKQEEPEPKKAKEPKKKADKEQQPETRQPKHQPKQAEQTDSIALEKYEMLKQELFKTIHDSEQDITSLKEAAKKAEASSKRDSARIRELTQENSDLKQEVDGLNQNGTFVQTSSERELMQKLKDANDQIQMQMGANKSMAAKLLSLEKDLQTEKKRRLETEKKLLTSSASTSASNVYSHGTSDQDELLQVKDRLNNVASRILNSTM